MKKLFIFLLSLFSLSTYAQKRVAILEIVDLSDQVSYGIKMQVRSTFAYVISHNTGYEGYDRANVSVLFDNPEFQRTGSVSDTQIKELAKVANAAFVLIAEASMYDEHNLIITAKLLDGITGNIANTARPVIYGKAPDQLEEACTQLVKNLFDGIKTSAQKKDPALPEGYVDLELPSGSLWKSQNEQPRYFSFEDAKNQYGNNVPTKEQWLELKNSCKWVWEEIGYKIIGRNGQSIFLPAAGVKDCSGLIGDSSRRGWYWSSTTKTDYYASYMSFLSDEIKLFDDGSRCEGLSIRLVRPGGMVDLGLPSGTLWKSENEDEEMTSEEAKKQYGHTLPTKEQWQELIDHCSWTWVDPGEWQQDEEGGEYWHDGPDPYYIIKGKNGNSITLPAKGYVDTENLLCVACGGIGGVSGYYYASSINEKNTFYHFYFDDKNKRINSWGEKEDYRPFNMRIRLVYK